MSAIVLAGGRSARFGSDKLEALLDGRPLLHHAVLAVSAVAGDVVVVGGTGSGRLPEVPSVTIRRVPDAAPHAGPLAGVATGLAVARGELALVVGGDMPTLVRIVLEALVASVRHQHGIDAAALINQGRREPLPVAVSTRAAGGAASRAMAEGDPSLHGLLARLRVRELEEPAWRRLDPDGASLRDVDTPGDLTS